MDLDTYIESKYNENQKGCLKAALGTLDGLSETDLKNFVSDVEEEVNKKVPLGDAIKKSAEKLDTDLKNRLYALNYQYTELFAPETGLANIIKNKKANILDVLSKSTLKLRGRNVENMQNAISTKLREDTLGSLSLEAQKGLMLAEHERDIADYLDTGKSNNPIAQEIGDAINRLRYNTKKELLESTAMGPNDFNENRKLPISYDPVKLQKIPGIKQIWSRFRSGQKIMWSGDKEAKEKFIENMIKRNDLDATFGKNAKNMDKVREVFSDSYDKILREGKIATQGTNTVVDIPDLIKKKKMYFNFNSWNSYLDHIQEYGSGSGTFYEQMMSEINTTGRRAGLARTLGRDYNWGFNQLRKINLIANEKEGWWRNPENVFKNLTGQANIPYRPYVAQMQANLMSYLGMNKLAGLAITSLNDSNMGLFALTEITRTNEFQNLATKLAAVGKVYKSQLLKSELDPDLKRMLKNCHHSLQYEMGAAGRFIDAQNLGGITRKIQHSFYTIAGVSGKDAGTRSGAMYLASKALDDERETSFENLRPSLQKRLSSYDISPAEWDLMRKHTPKGLIGADSVFSLPKDKLIDAAKKSGKELIHFENDLHAKLFGYLNTFADETVLTPGALENAMINFGTQPGSVQGMMFRAFGQFKGFFYSYINRMLINGFQGADSTSAKFRWALSNFIYALPLTMIGNAFYDITQGNDPKLNPEEWDITDWYNNMLPGIGLFGRVLDPKQQNTNQLLMLLQSPSTTAAWDVAALGVSGINLGASALGVAGSPSIPTAEKHVRSKAAKLAYDFTPINSIPYLAPWWRQNAISTKN